MNESFVAPEPEKKPRRKKNKALPAEAVEARAKAAAASTNTPAAPPSANSTAAQMWRPSRYCAAQQMLQAQQLRGALRRGRGVVLGPDVRGALRGERRALNRRAAGAGRSSPGPPWPASRQIRRRRRARVGGGNTALAAAAAARRPASRPLTRQDGVR